MCCGSGCFQVLVSCQTCSDISCSIAGRRLSIVKVRGIKIVGVLCVLESVRAR